MELPPPRLTEFSDTKVSVRLFWRKLPSAKISTSPSFEKIEDASLMISPPVLTTDTLPSPPITPDV